MTFKYVIHLVLTDTDGDRREENDDRSRIKTEKSIKIGWNNDDSGTDEKESNKRNKINKNDVKIEGVNYHEFKFEIEKLNSSLSSEPGQVKTDLNTKRGRLIYGAEIFDKIKIIFYKVPLCIYISTLFL